MLSLMNFLSIQLLGIEDPLASQVFFFMRSNGRVDALNLVLKSVRIPDLPMQLG